MLNETQIFTENLLVEFNPERSRRVSFLKGWKLATQIFTENLLVEFNPERSRRVSFLKGWKLETQIFTENLLVELNPERSRRGYNIAIEIDVFELVDEKRP